MRKSRNKWGKTALLAFVAFDCVGIYAAYQKVNAPVDTDVDVSQIAANDLAIPPISASAPQFHGDAAPTAVVPGLVQPVSRAGERMAFNDAPKAVAPGAVPQAKAEAKPAAAQPVLALAAIAPAPKASAPKAAAPIAAPSFVAPAAHALAVKTAPKAATPKVAAPVREAAPHFAVSEASSGKTLVSLKPASKAKAAKGSANLASVAHYSHAKRDGRLFAKAFEHAFGPVGQAAPVLENPVAGGAAAQAYAEPAPIDPNAALDQPAVAAAAPSIDLPAPVAPAAAPAAEAELPPA